MSSVLKKSTYLKRVVMVLVFFTMVICIPYAITVYNTAQGKVLSTIQNSNDQSLQQIKYNYTVNQDTMANLCMSIYYDRENQGLLYNSNISYAEAGQKMRDMKATIMAIYPSIYEVSIYNGSRNELYSTRDNQLGYFQNTADFIQSVRELPKLQPILRRVPYGGTENYIYVFSYFFYEYTDSENKPSSYVLLEQNANWMINNFTTAGYLNRDLPGRIYLVDKDNRICSDTEVSETDLELLSKNPPSESLAEEGKDAVYYTDSVSGREYLVTRLSLNDWGDSLIMIQDYDQVLAELKSLQRTYWLIIGIWAFVYLIAIVLIGKHLYQPIDNLVKFINELDGKAKVVPDANEFSQIMELYKEAHEKLLDKNEAKQAFMRRYQFEKLLTDEKSSVWKEICSYLPEHWLVTSEKNTLRVLKVKIQMDKEQSATATEEDKSLYQFVVQNVLSELMEKEYQAEIFQLGDDSICGIVQAGEGTADAVLEGILQETQQYAKRYMNISFCAAYSDTADSPMKLNALYKQTDELLEYRFVYGKGAIMNSRLCRENMENQNTVYPESLERKLLAEVKCKNLESAQRLTEEIFDYIGTMRYENIQSSIMTLANNLHFTLKELYTHTGTLAKFQFDQIYHLISESGDLDELETHLKEYIESALDALTQKNETDKGQIFVQNVQAYVEENYSDPNLSSHSVGDHLGLTGKYVMKKFQDYTGSSLNDYIYKVRMGKAAQLLVSSNTSISKVAEQVGILNENYFYRLFKKAYGCTPREYSNQNRQY